MNAPWKTMDSAPKDGTPFVWMHWVTVLSTPVTYKAYAEVVRRCWMGAEKKGDGFWMGQSISRSEDELKYGWWMPAAPLPDDENQEIEEA
jgi:hypothetical protein